MAVPVATRQTAPRARADPQRSAAAPGPRMVGGSVATLHHLHRGVGNRAITRLLLRRTIQPKLTVSHPEDESEREADRVADQVMRITQRQVQRTCACDKGECTNCPKEQGGTEHVQTKRTNRNALSAMVAPPIVNEVLRSPGQPLDAPTRHDMGARLGHDFSHVRVHTDERAASSSEAVNAKAYTVGSHIIFSSGEFAPGSRGGRRLLAHELVHVLQQRQDSAARSIFRKEGLAQAPANMSIDEGGEQELEVLLTQITDRTDQNLQLRQQIDALPETSSNERDTLSKTLAAKRPGAAQLQKTRVAIQGLGGPGTPLPHLAQIQSSFGHHDVSGVRAHLGPEAYEANRRISAAAYTFGDQVAFAGLPSLHTAAHEAAHVVQQRSGVHLKNNLGEPGDAYEKHADAVADLVVMGAPVEPLLDVTIGSPASHSTGATGTGVQRAETAIQMQQKPQSESPQKFPEILGLQNKISEWISIEKIKSPMMRALAEEYVNWKKTPPPAALLATPYISEKVRVGTDELDVERVFKALMSESDLKKTGKGDKATDWSFEWIDAPNVQENKSLGEQSKEIFKFGLEEGTEEYIDKKYAAPDAGKHAIERVYVTKQHTWGAQQKAKGNLAFLLAKSGVTGELPSGMSVVEAISEPVARWTMKNVLKVSAEVATRTIPIIGYIFLAYDVLDLLISLNSSVKKQLSPSRQARLDIVADVRAYLEGKAAAAAADLESKKAAAQLQEAVNKRFDPNKFVKPPSSDRFPMRMDWMIQRKAAPEPNQLSQSLALRPAVIQPKLTISHPEDESEREADRVADQVMRMPDPGENVAVQHGPGLRLQRACSTCEKEIQPTQPVVQRVPAPVVKHLRPKTHVGRVCANCEEKKEDEEDAGILQAKSIAGAPPLLSSAQQNNIDALHGGGRPLPANVHDDFASRFGRDFSNVRVHTGAGAAAAAREISARAFTVGSDIAFASGEYNPTTQQGRRLLAHELAHTVQQRAAAPFANEAGQGISSVNSSTVQRSETPDAGVMDATPEAAGNIPVGEERFGVSLAGKNGVIFSKVFFPPEMALLRQVVEKLMVSKGTDAANDTLDWLKNSALWITAERRDKSGVDAESDVLEKLAQRLDVIIPNLSKVRASIKLDHEKFIKNFELLAKANVLATLKTSEETIRREAVRYGIKFERIKIQWFGGIKAEYGMKTGTPVLTGLQKASAVLLARRKKIDELVKKQRGATRMENDPWESKAKILVPDEPRYSELGAQVKEESQSYEQLRAAVTAEYPILASVSELDKSADDLETISKKGAGSETAQVLGAQIGERLANIHKVRANLHDKSEVNIWRLPPVVDITGAQLGVQSDPLKQRWVSEQIEEEKPGMLGAIALLIFNLLAIALAPVTAGISLAVAAGVNVVATGLEVDEYMMKKALSGTDFDKARSLSQEEPSLFWLALSIVGTIFDVAAAAAAIKAFRALAPLAKAAEAAKGTKEAEEAIEALAKAAKKAGGDKLAEKAVANVRRARAGESVALEAAGATKAEREALEAAGKAAEAEVAKLIGAPVRTAQGEVKLSKAGHLFSCSSPCTELREKYAAILAKDKKLEAELGELEKRALAAATEEKAGGPNSAALAEAVKNDAAALERRILLGVDPKRGYIAYEGDVGALIEKKYGGFVRDTSGDGEWIGISGAFKDKVFDLVGIPEGAAKYHSDALENFLPSVKGHFLKSIDFVVLDTRHMRPAQKQTVLNFVQTNFASQLNRLIIL